MARIESSEYNGFPEVTGTLSFAENVFIVDSTIRSLQSGVSGSVHTARDLIEIGKALDDLGVHELIINLSWKDGLEVCEGLAKENPSCKIVGTFRARNPYWKKWSDEGIRAGADEICFESIPDIEYLRRAADLVQSKGKKVSHAFAEIYTYQEVVDLCREGVRHRFQSQSFHDSFFRFGITPEAIKFLVKSLKAGIPQCPPLYVHLSNFYGQGAMTAVAALVAGANAADVCMNGIGHHCGHVELAEVVLILEALYGISTGIRLEKLREVSLLIRERTGIPAPITKPVVGDCAFLTDGAYWAAEAHLPFDQRVHAKFPLPPDRVGATERVVWSEKTITPESVKAKLESMKFPFQEGAIESIIMHLEGMLREKKAYPKWILDSEFERLCRSIISTKDG